MSPEDDLSTHQAQAAPSSMAVVSAYQPAQAPQHLQFNPTDTDLGSSDTDAVKTKVPPVFLRVEDLSYGVYQGKSETQKLKPILQNINLEVAPGQVLAILGSSGAGKTSLLNLLAGRLTYFGPTEYSGSVFVNGQKRDFATFRQKSAYVLQDDSLFAVLTVRETITLSAMLRLPNTMTKAQKEAKVDEIILELGLKKCQDTYVGDDVVRGVSGGERKRVSIGMELVTDPSIIFIDEPTSGLDAFNSQNVMAAMSTLAQHHRTVIATIHQPRSSIYQMFDLMMLLSEGQVMYFGKANDAVNYFSRVGYTCPPSFNPADYFIDLISFDGRTAESEKLTKERIAHLAKQFEKYRQGQPALVDRALEAKAGNFAEHSDDADKRTTKQRKYATNWWQQLELLTMRSFRLIPRNKTANIASIAQTLIFGVLLGLIWLDEGSPDTNLSINSVMGVLFFILIHQAFTVTSNIMFLFPQEKAVMLKERASRSYSVSAYFLSKTLSELPRTALLGLTFTIIVYFMINLRSGAEHFFIFFLLILLVNLTAEGLTYLISALARDAQQAASIVPLILITNVLFAGFLIDEASIPVYLRWLRFITFLRYGFAGFVQNEYEGRQFNFDCANSDGFCPSQGDEVMTYFNTSSAPLYGHLLILLAFAVGFRFMAYLVLRYLRGPKFNSDL